MPRYTHPKTKHSIETSVPREGQELKSHGYRETKARTEAVKAADDAKSDKPKGAPKSNA